ncbi:hypothetical protein HY345_01145 [Candidatus Microgenomates bacterium]|nr:hypothetical protein [Candidatus Microgenomates bacterium]
MANGKKGSGLLAAGVIGLAVGAVGSLVGMFLSKEENRKKVVREANVLKKQGEKTFKELESKAVLLRKKVKAAKRK